MRFDIAIIIQKQTHPPHRIHIPASEKPSKHACFWAWISFHNASEGVIVMGAGLGNQVDLEEKEVKT